jgi:pantoate ligase/cytidylate kinase
LDDEPAIAELVSACNIEFNFHPTSFTLVINGEDVTDAIRSLEVTSHVSAVAALPVVRHFMVQQQQRYGRKGGIVAEGRDIGTNVFPDAEVKIFLTASVKERSRRRLIELQTRGQHDISLEQLEIDLALRDEKDSTRAIAPLRKAADAIEIQTDGLTVVQVTERIVNLYQQRNIRKDG